MGRIVSRVVLTASSYLKDPMTPPRRRALVAFLGALVLLSLGLVGGAAQARPSDAATTSPLRQAPVHGLSGYLNGWLPETTIYAECADWCDEVAGTAVVRFTHASARKVGVSSTLIGSYGSLRSCGPGVRCWEVVASRSLKKKLKTLAGKRPNGAYLPGTVTLEMTSPHQETIKFKVRFGDGSNGGRFSYCGEGAQYCSTGGGSDGDSA
jgi:hypothetical protein